MSGRAARFAPTAFLIAAGLLVFAPHVRHAGLHLDDYGFHGTLSRADLAAAWQQAVGYTPGRNIYILYYWAMYKVLGPHPSRLHLVGLALDILNACLAFALLRRLELGRWLALLAAGLFLVYPNHAETHFWTSSVAMNLFSTTLVLLAFLAAGARSWPAALRVSLGIILFGLGLFDYDQVFFMWVPLAYLLAAERDREGGLQPRWIGVLAASCLALCCGHYLLRTHTVVAGNSPSVRLGSVGLRAAQSLAASLVPMLKLPRWEALQSFAGGPVPTLILCLALAGAWLHLVLRLRRLDGDGLPPSRAFVFGALWFFCAYLPNYFWYLSPRHHYLPSLGFVLAVVLAAGRWASRVPASRPILSGAALAFFALSCASGLAAGYGWRRSASLHDLFVRQAQDLLPPNPESIFLLDAPRTVLRAPGFSLTTEHLDLYAGITGRSPTDGDISLSPSRKGGFFRNQPELYGKDYFWWHPAETMAVIFYRLPERRPGRGRDQDFSCAGHLEVRPPGLPPVRLPLDARSPQACREGFPLDAAVWLVSAKTVPPPKAAALFDASNGVSLVKAAGERRGEEAVDIILIWKSSRRPDRDFAFVPRLDDPKGTRVFEPVYPAWSAGQKQPDLLWPAFNDLSPASGWRPGAAIEERWRLRLQRPLPPGPLSLRLSLLERRDHGPWKPLAEFTVPLGL